VYRTGELDTKIDVFKEVKTSDGIGGETISSAVVRRDIWAKYRPLSGKEMERFDKLVNEELAVFVMRRREDISDEHYIQYQGLNYNIVRVPPTNKREMYMNVYVETGVAI